jgi:hypothetical protein
MNISDPNLRTHPLRCTPNEKQEHRTFLRQMRETIGNTFFSSLLKKNENPQNKSEKSTKIWSKNVERIKSSFWGFFIIIQVSNGI